MGKKEKENEDLDFWHPKSKFSPGQWQTIMALRITRRVLGFQAMTVLKSFYGVRLYRVSLPLQVWDPVKNEQ